MKITVCIPSIRATTIRAAIDSITLQTWTDWELIVIGQGDDPGLDVVCREMMKQDVRIRYVHTDIRGVSLARNLGFANAATDIVAFMDDDCEADSEWLSVIAQCFEDDPELGGVSGSLVVPKASRRGISRCPGITTSEAVYDPKASGRKPPVGWDWVGANVAFRRTAWETVGPFDECLGAGTALGGAEDTDYKLRLEAANIKMRSTPRAIMHHTYGRRYGLRASMKFAKSYAAGSGALAGKLVLLNDPRGKEWLHMTRKRYSKAWMQNKEVTAVPAAIFGYYTFMNSYRLCLQNYKVNAQTNLLFPINNVP